MDTPQDNPKVRFAFGEYVFDPSSGELQDGQKTVQLRPQVAKLLALLLSHADSIVSRDDIRNCLWSSHTVVEFEEGISACMRQLRVALNDGIAGTRYVQTISRRGYKFVYPVAVLDGENVKQAWHAVVAPVRPGASPLPVPGRRRWVMPLAALIVLLILGGIFMLVRFKNPGQFFARTTALSPHPVIAVLPFDNLSVNPDNTILGASFASELIDLLGPIAPQRLGVIADTSSAHYASSGKTISTIGRELGADYVLEGSITQNSRTIQVSARLIRAADQSYVWGEEYNLAVKYPGGAYQQTAVQIAARVAKVLAPDVNVQPSVFTSNRAAANAYQYGHYLLEQGRDDEAAVSCRKAMQLDPRFAAAHVCVAYALLARPNLSATELTQAGNLAQRALELDGDSSEAHLLKATLDMSYSWNLSAALPEFKAALQHNPGSAQAWQKYAGYWSALGQNLQMQQAMQMARTLDPGAISKSADSALVFYVGHQYDKAEYYSRASINLAAGNAALARHLLILTLLGEGKYAEAVQQAALEMQYLKASPDAIAQVQIRNRNALVQYFRWYAQRLSSSLPDKQTAMFLADAYMHLGGPQQAIKVLSDTVANHAVSTLIPFMSVWPSLHPLCRDNEFVSLALKLGQMGCTPNG